MLQRVRALHEAGLGAAFWFSFGRSTAVGMLTIIPFLSRIVNISHSGKRDLILGSGLTRAR